jgi:hypothetical protein
MRILHSALLIVMTATAVVTQTFDFASGRTAQNKQLSHFEGISMTEKKNASGPDDFRWQGRINSGQAIEIKGVRGNIRAEAASGNEVEVVATKGGPNGAANKVSIKVLEHGQGVTICAVYPTIDPNQPYVCRPGIEEAGDGQRDLDNLGLIFFRNNEVRVDFTVRVPAGIRFVGRTLKGEVEASSLKSDIDAFTVNGNVRVSTDGNVRARSMTGSIDASLAGTNWTRPIDLQTVNGDIVVALPTGANTSVRGETSSGRIMTDFPLTVEKSLRLRRVNGVIGSGGGTLSLKTMTGSIKLQRTP